VRVHPWILVSSFKGKKTTTKLEGATTSVFHPYFNATFMLNFGAPPCFRSFPFFQVMYPSISGILERSWFPKMKTPDNNGPATLNFGKSEGVIPNCKRLKIAF
jgi:hypothetical protein